MISGPTELSGQSASPAWSQTHKGYYHGGPHHVEIEVTLLQILVPCNSAGGIVEGTDGVGVLSATCRCAAWSSQQVAPETPFQ